jgi:hypothetical protein
MGPNWRSSVSHGGEEAFHGGGRSVSWWGKKFFVGKDVFHDRFALVARSASFPLHWKVLI